MVEYLPILIYVGVAIVFPITTFVASRLLRASTSKGTEAKFAAYECGIEPETEARDRYSVQYYIIAVLFVIFDVETIFLFPWAVKYRELALFGLIEMLVFIGILVVGYAYAWRKGALEWVS
jgi:NADH-quinone oxidoreductase subunit A